MRIKNTPSLLFSPSFDKNSFDAIVSTTIGDYTPSW
jgi:hypothetical protein